MVSGCLAPGSRVMKGRGSAQTVGARCKEASGAGDSGRGFELRISWFECHSVLSGKLLAISRDQLTLRGSGPQDLRGPKVPNITDSENRKCNLSSYLLATPFWLQPAR